MYIVGHARNAFTAPPSFKNPCNQAAIAPHAPNRQVTAPAFGHHYWWPLLERNDVPKDAKTFIAELASGVFRSVRLLDPALLWYGGRRGTIEEFFDRRPRAKIVSSNHDERYRGVQPGTSEIMLCGDRLDYRGYAPAYFGVRADAATERSISLRAGSPLGEGDFFNAGASWADRRRAILDGEVFHPSYVADAAETFRSHGLTIETIDKIEHLSAAPVRDPLDFYWTQC